MKWIKQFVAVSMVLLFSQSLFAQSSSATESTPPDEKKSRYVFNTALSKGSTHVSYYTSLQGGFSSRPNWYFLEYTFNPKVNFFICDKLNVGLGYLGVKINSSETPLVNAYSHNIEAEISYFFFSRPHSFFSVQIGYVYGQASRSILQQAPSSMQQYPGSALKVGATATRRLKRHESFGLSFNPTLLFDVQKTPTSFFDSFYTMGSIGVNYFFASSSGKTAR